MKIGINYDTGVFPGGRISRPGFHEKQVARDMNAIARDLRCDAVRISGGDPERISIAAELAAEAGLEVWFSPMPCERDPDEMLAIFDDAARRAEQLRSQSARGVVFVAGCEISVFSRGFLPGENAYARLAQLAAPDPELFAEYPALVLRLNAFLARVAEVSHTSFGGAVTYAAGPWEQIDWTPFDLVAVDAYRNEANAATFDAELEALSSHGKPVAITEFGCCTYRGAAQKGANGWAIIDNCGGEPQLDGAYIRDEWEQVNYLRESLDTYRRHDVDAAFWYTFASWNRPHRENSQTDLDVASFGVVKIVDPPSASGEHWVPKVIFHQFEVITRGSREKGTGAQN